MWLAFAFLSALLLGFYDVFKKQSLNGNAVIPVLFLNTLFCSLIFLPFIVLSACGSTLMENSMFYVPIVGWEAQKYIILKSCIVLSSWILGYFAIKHLPITFIGPINATRPVMVLLHPCFRFQHGCGAAGLLHPEGAESLVRLEHDPLFGAACARGTQSQGTRIVLLT